VDIGSKIWNLLPDFGAKDVQFSGIAEKHIFTGHYEARLSPQRKRRARFFNEDKIVRINIERLRI
jgi:hypothetical protein